MGAHVMKFKDRLPDAWAQKVSGMKEFANGATQVSVKLRDGREVRGVLISDARYIIAARGFKDLPFAMTEIADIFQSNDDKDPSQRGGWDFWDDWS
jgi:hypothetical protein